VFHCGAAVCYSTWQCVVCGSLCSMLQCVAVCCRVLQCVVGKDCVAVCVAVCCSVCCGVCCSMCCSVMLFALQCVANYTMS